MATYAQRLQYVRDAIDSIVKTGQSVSEEGRQLTMANLAELRLLEKDYELKAAEESALASNPTRGRNRVIYVTPQ